MCLPWLHHRINTCPSRSLGESHPQPSSHGLVLAFDRTSASASTMANIAKSAPTGLFHLPRELRDIIYDMILINNKVLVINTATESTEPDFRNVCAADPRLAVELREQAPANYTVLKFNITPAPLMLPPTVYRKIVAVEIKIKRFNYRSEAERPKYYSRCTPSGCLGELCNCAAYLRQEGRNPKVRAILQNVVDAVEYVHQYTSVRFVVFNFHEAKNYTRWSPDHSTAFPLSRYKSEPSTPKTPMILRSVLAPQPVLPTIECAIRSALGRIVYASLIPRKRSHVDDYADLLAHSLQCCIRRDSAQWWKDWRARAIDFHKEIQRTERL